MVGMNVLAPTFFLLFIDIFIITGGQFVFLAMIKVSVPELFTTGDHIHPEHVINNYRYQSVLNATFEPEAEAGSAPPSLYLIILYKLKKYIL